MSFVNYDSLFNCLLDTKVRYVSIPRTVFNWYKNHGATYTVLSLDDVRARHKKSDTIFILGGGESINHITKQEWDHIANHDSFGMNWWPVHWFVPSFYYTNFPRGKVHFQYFQCIIGRKTDGYHNTVFFVSANRAVRRGIHPRVLPDFFRSMRLLCFYEYEEPVRLKRDEYFTEASFRNTINYRGGLSLILSLIDEIGYKNIILMGIDLHNAVHFYDRDPEMKWQFEEGYSKLIEVKQKIPHPTMDTKRGTKLSIDKYLYAVNGLYFRPRGIRLYIGSRISILAEKIPVYSFPR